MSDLHITHNIQTESGEELVKEHIETIRQVKEDFIEALVDYIYITQINLVGMVSMIENDTKTVKERQRQPSQRLPMSIQYICPGATYNIVLENSPDTPFNPILGRKVDNTMDRSEIRKEILKRFDASFIARRIISDERLV